MVANVGVPMFSGISSTRNDADTLTNISVDSLDILTDAGLLADDSIVVDTANNDTIKDSLQLAIDAHNKAIDDSLRLDSINRRKKNGIDAPVVYSGNDSLVYLADNKTAHIYGDAKVDYENMNLEAEYIHMSLDSNLVRAEGAVDSLGKKSGTPVFNMGSDKYESDQMAFNFKTKKGLIKNVYTQQDDGYMRSELSKRDSTGAVYMMHGKYTTCDLEHPDFYIALSRAKVRPGKDVVFGPAHLVVEDVPLPLAIPYGFFPFSKSYASGIIMPTYGDDSEKGFYLHNGGYYFALSDMFDLKLIGEIYTKGSWGITATTNYKKRYKYSGSLLVSFLDSKTGDQGLPDFAESKSFKVTWRHSQDSKANPYGSTFSANVNFATSSFEKSNLNSRYNPQSLSQSLRSSSISYSTGFSSIGMTLSTTMNIEQNMNDTTLNVTLPDLNISISRFYPFKRKHAVGDERWYEKINMSYTGHISNSLNAKESEFFKKSLAKDWTNYMSHHIPISATFDILGCINVTPSFTFDDYTYLRRTEKSWDTTSQKEVNDTVQGFFNVYKWSLSLSASTELYGFYTPSRKIFGDKIEAIRHVFKPTVTLSYAPDFSARRYRYYNYYQKTDANGNVSLVQYSPYQGNSGFSIGQNMTGTIGLVLGNNLEMKVKSDKDSTGFKKISLIDQFNIKMDYNMAAKQQPWSDLTIDLALKPTKNTHFNTTAVFKTYAYELDENGKPYIGNRTEYSYGRFGRYQGMSQNLSYTLNPENLKKLWKKLFGGGDDDDESADSKKDSGDDEEDYSIDSNVDHDMEKAKHSKARGSNGGKAETDADGYMAFKMPWSLSIGYGITLRENTSGEFNKKSMRYPYSITQSLNLSGNISLSDGWNINFSSGYDFDAHALSLTQASLSRDLHCFSMSCEVVLAPYTSYNFSFRCNASTLADALKYDKRSSSSYNVKWY